MTGWPGSDSPNFMDADHQGYISDQKRIAELETALRGAIALIRADDHPTRQGMADNFEKTLNG